MIGMIHGLSPAAIHDARVLEIGCGEGYNLIGMAAAYPTARLEGFDLAATAIEIGQAQAKAAGLTNVTLYPGDITELADTIEPGAFDFVIAHGVYAWVPEPVRDATLRLVARALSPHGIAYVSYNALPGGHFRMAMRDLLLHEVGHIEDPRERLAAAKTVLEELSEMDSRGEVTIESLKLMARDLLKKHEIVLFHDELGGIYAPHSLTQMAANAEKAGLRYLADSDAVRIYDSLVAEGDDAEADPAEIDRMLIRRMQSRDNRNTCFFRSSLLVRADAPVRRKPDLSVLDDLWVSTSLKYDAEQDAFVGSKDRRVKLADDPIKAAFQTIVEAQPGRLPLREVITDDRWREVFMKLFAVAYLDLHTLPAPFVAKVGEKPETSPFARFQIAQGSKLLARLDHDEVNIDQENLRALLLAANGERTVAEIAAEVDGVFPADEIVPALNAAAAIALMRS